MKDGNPRWKDGIDVGYANVVREKPARWDSTPQPTVSLLGGSQSGKTVI